MPDEYFVANRFITKRLIVKEQSGERFFEGILSVEMTDKQGEITIIDELYKCLPIWMDRGGSISDTHTNRIVGRGINYAKVNLTDPEGNTLPAIKIIGKIYNHTELDNHIWEQMKNKVYKGLSFGGATKSDRTPVIQGDGSIAYSLKDLELYEIAVCEDPAVPFALITELNPTAKAIIKTDKADVTYRSEEEVVIKCDEVGCYVNRPIEKSFFGQKEDTFPTEDEELKPKTKPLPTKWGKLEFEACESHASKDPDIKDPGGYCGSIQAGAEKATKIPVGEKVFDDTDSCISQMNGQERIKDPEAYCGARHNEEHGMNPKDPSHKASISEEKPLEDPLEEVEKPCSCQHKAADPSTSRGVNMPSGLGAYNTTVNGTGQTDTITPEKLGNPDKLPNKPKNPTKEITSNKDSTSTIFINPFIRNKDNNMTDKILEQVSKADEEVEAKEEKKTEEVEAKEDKKEESKEESNKALASINESLKAIAELIKSQNDKLDKAMEKPTDLPQSPKGTADKEDVGDKVSVPKDPYPQGEQSGIQDANGKVEDKPESDKGDLKMQEKAVRQTEVSRPSGLASTEINKNTGKDDTFISYRVLQKARTLGSENLSALGKDLLNLAENYDKEGRLEW